MVHLPVAPSADISTRFSLYIWSTLSFGACHVVVAEGHCTMGLAKGSLEVLVASFAVSKALKVVQNYAAPK